MKTIPLEEFFQCIHNADTRSAEILIQDHPTLISAKDTDGRTALHAVAGPRERWFAQKLVGLGADVNAPLTKNQRTPLHIAAERGAHGVIECLFASQYIDRDARDSQGKTPLYLALLKGEVVAARFLIWCNVSVNAHDQNGVSPLHLAALLEDEKLIELLLQRGSNPNKKTSAKCRLGTSTFQAGLLPKDFACTGKKSNLLLKKAEKQPVELPKRVQDFLEARPTLEAALRDESTRAKTLRSLSQYGPIAAVLLTHLLHQYRSEPAKRKPIWKQQEKLLANAKSIGEKNKSITEIADSWDAALDNERFLALSELLFRGEAETRQYPAHQLSVMGARALPMIQALADASLTYAENCQWPAIKAIGSIGPLAAKDGFDALVGALRRYDLSMQGESLEALCLMGDAALDALPATLRLLKWIEADPNFSGGEILWEDAMKLFVSLGKKALARKGVSAAIKRGVQKQTERARAFSAWACYRLLDDLPTALPILQDAAKSDDEDLYSVGIELLFQLEAIPDEAMQLLKNLSKQKGYPGDLARHMLEERKKKGS